MQAQVPTAVERFHPGTISPTVAPGAPDIPLTASQKFQYSFHQVFGPSHLFAITAHAAFQQATDRPNAWGEGYDAYAVRMASILGRSLVRESLAFGIRAADHEDPRYFISGEGTVLHRTRYALAHTFITRNDSGGTMPAYSRFVADFATPFIAEQWWPGRFRTGPLAVRAGAAALGCNAVSNIFQEFWPDIRKKILRHTNSDRLTRLLKQ